MTALGEYADRHEMHFAGPAAKTPWIRRIESKYADAAIESLKVCGNCDNWRPGTEDLDEISDPLPWCAQHGAPTVDGPDRCHFTPSRWKERA